MEQQKVLVPFTIRLETGALEDVGRIAAELRVSRSWVIRRAIQFYTSADSSQRKEAAR